MNRLKKFEEIKKAYSEFEKDIYSQGKKPMKDTVVGFWGCTSMTNAYEFFERIHLEKYKNFLDLGSGDGRIVLIASLFTSAHGVEFDKELFDKSVEMKKKLNLNAEFINKDFNSMNLSKYDFLFIFPDKSFYMAFEDKLTKEMKGVLAVYNNIFLPTFLKKKKVVWVNQVPVSLFEK